MNADRVCLSDLFCITLLTLVCWKWDIWSHISFDKTTHWCAFLGFEQLETFANQFSFMVVAIKAWVLRILWLFFFYWHRVLMILIHVMCGASVKSFPQVHLRFLGNFRWNFLGPLTQRVWMLNFESKTPSLYGCVCLFNNLQMPLSTVTFLNWSYLQYL